MLSVRQVSPIPKLKWRKLHWAVFSQSLELDVASAGLAASDFSRADCGRRDIRACYRADASKLPFIRGMQHEETVRTGIRGEMKPLPPKEGGGADPDAGFVIESANAVDAPGIVALLEANRADPSIFLRPIQDVIRTIEEFVVARDAVGGILGCAALHAFSPECAEILTVAVSPEWHGHGAGVRLMGECLGRARAAGHRCVWLATLKPEYFGRFGFRRISRWSLPPYALLSLLLPLLRQPMDRWWNALRGTEIFMQLDL